MSEPNAPVVRPVVDGVQLTPAASASAVRQMPPPAAAIHARQPLPGRPQFGSTARAVTRPEFVVGAPVYVTSRGTRGTNGPTSAKLSASPGADWVRKA